MFENWVLGQADRPVESTHGLLMFSLAAARGERGPHSRADKRRPRPGRSHPVPPVSGFRSVRFTKRCGISSSRAERRRYTDKLFVEQHDRGPAAAPPLSVYRLNRGLELKPAEQSCPISYARSRN